MRSVPKNQVRIRTFESFYYFTLRISRFFGSYREPLR